MTREERCELAIERGFTYDPETNITVNETVAFTLTVIKGDANISSYLLNST